MGNVYIKLGNDVAAELDRQRAEYKQAEMTREEFVAYLLMVRAQVLKQQLKEKDNVHDHSEDY